jgi:large subunit ribosomal protein L17
MLRNLATSLFRHGRIETTEPRAKELARFAERLITHARKGDLASKRQVMRDIHDRDVVADLFNVLAKKYSGQSGVPERKGGYTRIVKLGFRKGDGAPVCLIELV